VSVVALRRCTLLVLLLSLFSLSAVQDTQRDALVYEQHSNQWFEGVWTGVAISADADWILLTAFGGGVRLVSLKTGREDRRRLTKRISMCRKTRPDCLPPRRWHVRFANRFARN